MSTVKRWLWVFNPKEYSKRYHYVWLMPFMALSAIYIMIVNKRR